ncbi:MAG: nucleotidyltransferase domain-containing protein [Anaerohalosphaeraceae bacterium]|nr:nucleotidyltransferase domain-containing protein [Anaerohalosphaeraceae bacterium]
MIKISEQEFKIVYEIIDSYLPNHEVMAFGSRTADTAKTHSDLDIAIMGSVPVDFKTLALLKDAFSESDLPFRVDVLQWCRISPEFKKTIKFQLQTLHKAS